MTAEELARVAASEQESQGRFRHRLHVCVAAGCLSSGVDAVMRRAYLEIASLQPQIPHESLPPLLPRVRPVHAVVTVDVFIPGCPPSADTISFAMSELLAGRLPDFGSGVRFG
jgi:coenzyme F420-reducing hydrogenase gamma subunit